MSEKKTLNISKKLIAIIAICIIVIVILICRAILNKNPVDTSENEDYKLPVEYYYSGIQNRDFETFLKAYPEFMQIDSMITAEDLNNYYEQYKDECGENISMSYEIDEAVAYSAEELQELVNEINTMYKTDVNFTEAYKVNVKTTYSGDENSVEKNTEHTVVKYNDQWYSL